MVDASGNDVFDQQGIADVFADFYEDLFAASPVVFARDRGTSRMG